MAVITLLLVAVEVVLHILIIVLVGNIKIIQNIATDVYVDVYLSTTQMVDTVVKYTVLML